MSAMKKIDRSFILPVFYYVDVNLDAVRTICGTIKGRPTSYQDIYAETAFIALFERRKSHKHDV